jgi:protein O-mannosyl-transferase
MPRSILFLLLLAAIQMRAQTPAPGGGNKTWAVIAGVSAYQNKEIAPLQFAHADAKAFYDYLISPAGGAVPKGQIQLLLNEQATTARFDAALNWLIEKAAEGDQVYIYFAGHGDVENRTIAQHGFLLTWDSPARSYVLGAYPLFYLQSVISTLSLQNKARVIMVADACRSGKLAGTAIQGPQITAASLQTPYANEIKILACGANEFSVEGAQWGGGRGAFSYHLIDGLLGLADRDGNYEVSLREIKRYLEDRVPDETDLKQNPIIIGDDLNLALALADPQILAQLKEAKTAQAERFDLIAMRGVKVSAPAKSDTLGERLYAGFQQALAEKRLLGSEKHSAWHYYELLAQRPEFETRASALRRDFAVALQEDAQQAVNAYLAADPRELARRWEEGPEPYAHIPSYLEKSVELLGPDHYMSPSLRSRQRYFEAMLLRMNDDPGALAAALARIEEAIALEPLGAHLYNEKGLIHSGLGQSEAEMAAYQKARELAPSWAMPVYNLGIAHRDLGNPNNAFSLMQEAISLREDFPEAHLQMGQLHLMKGQIQEAETEFLKSAKWEQPDAFYGLGNIYLETARPQLARDMYEQVIALAPRHPYANYALGIALNRCGDREKALEAYQQNILITPGYPPPYYGIALIYAEKGDNEQALHWLEKALDKGYSNKKRIMEDPDMAPLRETEAFKKLMTSRFPEE